LETVVMANSVHVSNLSSSSSLLRVNARDLADDFACFWSEHRGCPMRARDRIVASVCPQLHGLALVKLAVLLTLIGSPAIVDPASGSRVRGALQRTAGWVVADDRRGGGQASRTCC
jgi:DNA helicase MCM9